MNDEISSELPKGWKKEKLVDVCEYVKTGVEEFDGKIEYYSTGSIKDGSYMPEGVFSFSNRPSRANRMSKKEDVFQARMAGTNKALVVNKDLDNKLFSTGFIQLRQNKKCDAIPLYLYYYVQSPYFLKQRDDFATGTTQVALTDSGLKQIICPLSPLPEQILIVQEIEKQFARLDAAVKSLKAVKNKLEVYRKSVLKAAFEGKLCNVYSELTTISVNELGKIITGTTPSKKKKEYYSEDYCFFKPTDLNKGYFVIDSQDKLSEEGIKHARLLPEKSILVTCIGATIGKTGFNRVFGAINQQINAIVPNREKYVPEFIYYIFISDEIQRKIIANASSTTLPILNKSKFSNLTLRVPKSLEEQSEIVSEIESRFSVIDKLEETVNNALLKAEQLRKSILKSAFEGKIVEFK